MRQFFTFQNLKNFILNFKAIIYLMVLLALLNLNTIQAQSLKGKISGKIVDAENGEPLIGANVVLQNTMLGAASDLDGNYFIPAIPPGSYTLVITMMGYSKIIITDVIVNAGKVTVINTSQKPEIIETEGVIVTAKAIRNTEAALLKDRQRSIAVSDAISAEAISQVGSGDAADAMKQITGASVVDGKYIYIRGLGDRYTSTQLNGAEIPSTNPYKRAASVDIIPTNLLDNIVTAKSFTPDRPGNFSGGAIDIRTKDFPEVLTMSLSISSSFNPQTNLKNNGAILYSGGKLDWLGMDDGTRNIPSTMPPMGTHIPISSEAGQDQDKALLLDQYTKSFSNVMRPVATTFPLNQSYHFSAGNQVTFLGRPLGFIGSFSYSRNFTNYDDGHSAAYLIGGHVDSVQALIVDYDLKDQKSSEEVLWGGLFNAAYKLNPTNKLMFNVLYNRNGESMARLLDGKFPYESGDANYQTTVLSYNERTMSSMQVSGDHQFDFLRMSRISWKYSFGKSTQDEPDIRFFTNSYDEDLGYYNMKLGHVPTRYFRYLDEDRNEFSLDVIIPFSQWGGKLASFKFGGLTANKGRNFTQRKFIYDTATSYNFNGDVDQFFSNQNIGIVDSLSYEWQGQRYTRYDFGLYIQEPIDWVALYNGSEDISAGYAMLDLPLSARLRFVGGARFESTNMNVVTQSNDPRENYFEIKQSDLLPSANLIYSLRQDMNFRLVYGKTLARPTFREAVPYKSYEFFNSYEYKGNPNLKQTMIDNIDLRWEWFSRPGEIYAISAFYKLFKNPIEQRILTEAERIITWDNVDRATVMGVELEARKRLDVINELFSNFSLGSNLTLVYSDIDIAKEELAEIRIQNPYRKSSRSLASQSPYIFNINFNYDNPNKRIASTLYYNVFGERLSFVTEGGAPDVYELPFHLLNFSISYKFINHLGVKFTAKNLLDSEMEKIQKFKGTVYNFTKYTMGRTYSIELKYEL
ncbi:MAG TPA: TonB-dependent receptor [bacterium]|nr:TonB-dependent receptor [bacterium]